jgi:hypothetical protein
MASSGMLHCVGLVRIDVSEELTACIIRVTRIGELRTLAVTSNRRTLGSPPHVGLSVRRRANNPEQQMNLPAYVTKGLEHLRSTESAMLGLT